MSRPDRILAYDVLRLFAIVSVVAIHSLMPYRGVLDPTSPVRVIDDLLHYAVPLFVFMSGALVWGRPSAEKTDYPTFLSRRAALILVPYFAWSALYLAVLTSQAKAPTSAAGLLGMLLNGHTWYHLYFIPMLFTFYLLTPLARRLMQVSPELLLVVAYALRIFVGPEIEAGVAAWLGQPARLYAMHVIAHLPHMALGAWFVMRLEWIPKRWWLPAGLLAAGTAVLTAASYGLHRELPAFAQRLVYPVGLAATVLGIALLALLLEPAFQRFRRPINVAAALAFGVYFVHPLFLLATDNVVALASAESLWQHPAFWFSVFAGVTAASFGVSAWLARLPLAHRFIGLAKPHAAPTPPSRD